MDKKTTLILHRVCPFAERTFITLLEKNIPHELKEVSLTNKQPYFTETYKKAFAHDPNSDGKVPILIDGDKTLTESDLITWYLAEHYKTGTQLIPQDAFERLRLRWFTQSNSKIVGQFYKLKGFKNKTPENQEKQLEGLHKALKQLDDSITLPYALGNQFTLADIFIYPWFARWCAVEDHSGVKLDEKYTKIHEWVKNIQARESVKSIIQPNQFYIDGYNPYWNQTN